MSDIFISYAIEDRERAKILAEALEAQDWSVWWDRVIPAGRTFDEVIEEAIDAAKCIVVMWSEASVKSRWVRTEAEEGAHRGILVPVLIEDVRIPLAFRRIQAADLIDWDGSDAFPALQKLVADIKAVLGPSSAEAEAKRRAEEEQQAELKRQQEEQRQVEEKVQRKAKEGAERRAAEAKRQAELKRKQEEERRLREAKKEVGWAEENRRQPTAQNQRVNWFRPVIILIGVSAVIVLVVFSVVEWENAPAFVNGEEETKVRAETEVQEVQRQPEVERLKQTELKRKQKEGWRDSLTGMEFVWVPEGCFDMGSNEGDSDEKPVHEVSVEGFWMGKYEVTQRQ